MVCARSDSHHVVLWTTGLAGSHLDTIITDMTHFFGVRLRIDWFIKVVIERHEVVAGAGVEMNVLVLLTLDQLAGGDQPLLVRGLHQAAEGPVVIDLGRPLLVFE